MAKSDAKTNLLEHSEAKVELYGRYLAKYLNIISRDGYTNRISIYDLFCGEGKYDDGGKGSPVIAAETIQKNFGAKPYFCPNIKILFNDSNATKIEKLQSIISTYTLPGNCKIDFTCNDYNIILQEVIREINNYSRNQKGMIFIDPYGYKEIKLEQIKSLLENKKTEVLLFLPCHFMFRFANSSILQATDAREHLHRFIKEVFGENIEDFKNSIDFIERLKNGFRNFLGNFYVDTFTLEREKGQFFALFFFTSHIRGFEKMLETKWELDEANGKGYKYEKSGSLFQSTEVNDWEGILQDYILSEKRYNKDVYEFSLHNGYLPKHTNQILESWAHNGKLKVIAKEGETIKRNAFYLNYKNYIASPNKIYFKLT